MSLFKTLDRKHKAWEHSLKEATGTDLSDPARRRAAWRHFNLVDHAFLRALWSNLDQIAPGVYRSNHPSPKRVAQYKAMGIKAILSLRGKVIASPYLLETEACAEHGISMIHCSLSARHAAPRQNMLDVIDAFRTIEKPFLMHCKSGADRAGLAAVMYLNIIEGVPMREARKQLHWRYLHLKFTKTGILDHILDMYEARNAQGPISLEEWIGTEYDPALVRASYEAKGASAP
ncbi:tyrosine-protein phosphatase [Pseudogemmobacter sp. W21_MBD1_M6]|uniref:tyrosine-protein phosphatase n=1 Tax=Pseudogemmobacter sp. W21_MBD1_M6 TaxID=3240271 RepID=UPI003F9DC3F0